jgi:hypothetical protein
MFPAHCCSIHSSLPCVHVYALAPSLHIFRLKLRLSLACPFVNVILSELANVTAACWHFWAPHRPSVISLAVRAECRADTVLPVRPQQLACMYVLRLTFQQSACAAEGTGGFYRFCIYTCHQLRVMWPLRTDGTCLEVNVHRTSQCCTNNLQFSDLYVRSVLMSACECLTPFLVLCLWCLNSVTRKNTNLRCHWEFNACAGVWLSLPTTAQRTVSRALR